MTVLFRKCLCVGSGKTLAYLLPMIESLHRSNTLNGPCALPNKPHGIVVVPSRELAEQIHVMFDYSYNLFYEYLQFIPCTI